MTLFDRLVPVDRRAFRLYRANFWWIVLVSAVIFAPLSLFSVVANQQADDWIDDPGNGPLFALLAFAASALVVFGYALCCGLLDKLVVGPEFGHPREPLGRVLRTLPYGRLFALDLLTTAGIAIGLVLGIVPGIVLFTFIALAPPLMVSEHLGVGASLRRSIRLVRGAFWLTFFAVTLPVFVEHEVFAVVELLFDLPLYAMWLLHLAASVFVLAIVVLCEITLALTLAEQEGRRASADARSDQAPGQAGGGQAGGGQEGVVAAVTDGLLSDA